MRLEAPALAILLTASLALADDSMRCGKWIVDDQVTVEDLVKKCGLPQSKEIETSEIRRRGANGVGTHVVGTTTIEKWTYKRTPGSLPMLVTIEDGKVQEHRQGRVMPAGEGTRSRAIRSFVLRTGRITEAQQRALELLWPKYGIEYVPRALDLDAVFGRSAARVAEIGFGNGENLAALARAHPERDFLGIEVHRPGVGRLMLALDSSALANTRIICHDAVEVLTHQLGERSLDEVLILFPDPWPKKRHHKRRLIQPPFIELVASRLRQGGLLRLATDWEPYALQMLEVLSACPALENLAPAGAYCDRASERVLTRFEKRGTNLGHGVRDLTFRRR